MLTLFSALGKAALLAPDAVRTLLADREHRHLALRALEKAGPEAADLIPDLMPADEADVDPDATHALGTIGAGDANVVSRMCQQIDRTLAEASQVQSIPQTESHEFHQMFYGSAWGATGTLARMGPAARAAKEVGPTVIPRLFALSRSPLPGHRAAAALALASCASGDSPDVIHEVVDRLLALTHDHSWVAGRAIDALGTLHAEPQRCVERLVELFDSFTEFDPDMGYHGAHARVCAALEPFGAEAAPALPLVIRELERELAQPIDQQNWPSDLIGLLRAMGPAAASAAPIVRRLCGGVEGREEQVEALLRTIEG
jgi:hypothetical protein